MAKKKTMVSLIALVMCMSLGTGSIAHAQEVDTGVQERSAYGESSEAEESKASEADDVLDKDSENTEAKAVPNGSQETAEQDKTEVSADTAQQKSLSAEGSEQVAEALGTQGIEPLSTSSLNNPRVEKDSSMEAGQKVTYDCVWFGNYPQAEVVPSAEDYTAITKNAMRDGDIIADSSLYGKLQGATGWSSNNDITINGYRFHRMKASDATYAKPGTHYTNYYYWADADTWHYFKYEPIKWRVLKTDGNQAFLLSDMALDNQRYNTVSESITWETSTVRSWLNGYGASSNKQEVDYSGKSFISSAFSSVERMAITDAVDKLFLLSYSEAYGNGAKAYGFATSENTYDEARRGRGSAYAMAMGMCWDVYSFAVNSYGNCSWWLRPTGESSKDAVKAIDSDGSADSGRYYGVNNYMIGVRPALTLDLSSDLHTYAGTVCSDGTVREENKDQGNGGNEGGGDEDPDIPVNPTTEKYKANVLKALPDMDNLGSAVLKGPEISIAGHTFNLFQTDISVSLPIWKDITVKSNEDKKTVDVLIGVKKELNTEENNAYWSETYREVKSLVEACGGTVDTTKLWNQFSKVRGKLKEFDANAVFKAKGNIAGYMKLQVDNDGNVQRILEGGVTTCFNAGASVKAPLWWIVYSEFGLGGVIDGKMYLEPNNVTVIAPNGELGLAVNPSIALGADIVVADVKGGLEGSIAGSVKFRQLLQKRFDEAVNISLTGKLFIKVDTAVPGMSGEFPFNFPEMELYPNLGQVTRSMSGLQYSEPEPVTSQMVKAVAKNSRNAVDTTKDSLVYENAKPKMVNLPNGQILMVYIDDTDGEAKLTYRLYDGTEWSDPAAVWDGGNLDTAGYLYGYNGTCYVMFESSSKKITEGMTAEQIAGLMDLYVAEYTAGGFGQPVKLGKSATWKYAYQLAEHDGKLCAVWAENSGNDIMLQSGNTTVYESQLNGTWQQPTKVSSADQVLTEMVSGTVGGTFVTAYTKDGQIYIGDKLLETSSVGEKADSLKIQDEILYVRIDGMLYAYDGNKLEKKNVECTASYQICGDSVYWILQDNFKSEILTQTMGSSGSPVAVTDEDAYIGGFSVVRGTAGKPEIAYTYQQVDESAEENPYGATILKFTEDLTRYQAEVSNVAYDVLSFTPGEENPLSVTIRNTGTEPLKQLTLTISDGNHVIYSSNVAESLNPGESKACEVQVQIPNDFTKENLTFTLSSDKPFEKDISPKYEVEYCEADIEIAENNPDEVMVKNNSQSASGNVTAILYDQNESGAEIQKIPIGILNAGEQKIVSIKDAWKKVSKDTSTDTKYIYCKVTQGADEYNLWNNSVVIEKQAGEEQNEDDSSGTSGTNTPDMPDSSNTTGTSTGETVKPGISNTPVKVSGITLSGISKKIAAGKKIKLTANVTPSDAANKSVKWKSSNKKVATVNSKGVVTMKKKSGGKKVTITATATDGSNIKATYKIISMKGVVKKVVISGKKTVKAGKPLKLKAKVTASKKANTKLKWTSSNTKYATVSNSGKVKTKKAGRGKKVKITAMATDGSGKKKTVTIKIK